MFTGRAGGIWIDRSTKCSDLLTWLFATGQLVQGEFAQGKGKGVLRVQDHVQRLDAQAQSFPGGAGRGRGVHFRDEGAETLPVGVSEAPDQLEVFADAAAGFMRHGRGPSLDSSCPTIDSAGLPAMSPIQSHWYDTSSYRPQGPRNFNPGPADHRGPPADPASSPSAASTSPRTPAPGTPPQPRTAPGSSTPAVAPSARASPGMHPTPAPAPG